MPRRLKHNPPSWNQLGGLCSVNKHHLAALLESARATRQPFGIVRLVVVRRIRRSSNRSLPFAGARRWLPVRLRYAGGSMSRLFRLGARCCGLALGLLAVSHNGPTRAQEVGGAVGGVAGAAAGTAGAATGAAAGVAGAAAGVAGAAAGVAGAAAGPVGSVAGAAVGAVGAATGGAGSAGNGGAGAGPGSASSGGTSGSASSATTGTASGGTDSSGTSSAGGAASSTSGGAAGGSAGTGSADGASSSGAAEAPGGPSSGTGNGAAASTAGGAGAVASTVASGANHDFGGAEPPVFGIGLSDPTANPGMSGAGSIAGVNPPPSAASGSRQGPTARQSYALTAVYFRRQDYETTADCLTAAFNQRIGLDVCQ